MADQDGQQKNKFRKKGQTTLFLLSISVSHVTPISTLFYILWPMPQHC